MTAPRTLQRNEHPLSRRDISREALTVLYGLHEHGYKSYVAGGGVRDLLLGRKPKDFDVVTDATPNEVKRVFRNCRLIGRRFRLAHVHFGPLNIEVATFRALQNPEAEGGEQHPHFRVRDGLVLRDNVWGTPEEDALRRDFTVNALFYNIADFSVIDYVGGLADLDARILRFIGEPLARCTEDPVRMIRAVRFAAALGLTIEPASAAAIRESAPRLALADRSRLYEEVLKLFFCGAAQTAYGLLLHFGLFEVLFPDLGAWLGRKPCTARCRAIAAALTFLDELRGGGQAVSPCLLFALLFGGLIEAGADERVQRRGVHRGLALYEAAVEELTALAERVQVPNAVRERVAEVLGCQPRLLADGGRRAEGLVTRRFFPEAVAYAECMARASGRDAETIARLQDLSRRHGREPGDGIGELPAHGGRRGRRGKSFRTRRGGDADPMNAAARAAEDAANAAELMAAAEGTTEGAIGEP